LSSPPERPAAARTGPGAPLPSFNELVNELLGLPAEGKPLQVRGMPLADMLNGHAHELLHTAAKRVHEDGSRDLSAEHLLWAAAKTDPARSLFLEVAVDPDVVAAEVAKVLPLESADGAEPARRGLGKDAARVIGTAHARARSTGSALVGPEHILDALLNEPEAGVAAILTDGSVDIRRLSMFTERDELRMRDDPESTDDLRDGEREDR
jgi:ATP-dependent Clp protease ATP-binding subunit ClpC